MNKNIRFYYYLSLFCILQYILVTAFLFYFYEGGSRYNISHKSYLFLENFLSDLGRVIGFNGKRNVTAVFYMTTLSVIGIGTLSFFIYLNFFFKNYKLNKYGLFIGAVSGVSLALVGIFAVDENRFLHLLFLGIGYILFFIALLIYNNLIFKEIYKYKRKFYLVTLLNVALLTYILILIFGGNPEEGIDSLFIQVISQKIIVYSQLIILGLVLILLPPKNSHYISNK